MAINFELCQNSVAHDQRNKLFKGTMLFITLSGDLLKGQCREIWDFFNGYTYFQNCNVDIDTVY